MDINNIILSSRIRLARNLSGLPFPNMGNDESSKFVLDNVLSKIKDNLDFDTYKLCEMSEEDIATSIENNLISKDVDLKNGGFAISNDETVSIMVNEEDHIRMQCIMNGLNLKNAYDIINDVDSELLKILDYAYDSELGFLTACPSNVGTGIRASVMMFLPALTISGNMEDIINSLKNLGITIRGINGEGSTSKGYIYQISNEVTLGKSEKSIIQEVESAVLKICDFEEKAIEKIKSINDSDLFNNILRSFGTLTNSYKLTSSEYFELSALTKLGIEIGLIKLKHIDVFDELNYACRPANLIKIKKQPLNELERDIFRAKYVKDLLTNEKIDD